LQGRYIQAHRWDGSYSAQLPQKFENEMTREKVSGKMITEYLENSMKNLRTALSFGFFKPFFVYNKGKASLHPLDFFCVEHDSGFSSSLFLEFSINHSFWEIPEVWSAFVWQLIHPDDYEGLRNASQFINFLEMSWQKFIEMNQKFATQKKEKILQTITDNAKIISQFQTKRMPLPSPHSFEFSVFRQEFEKIDIKFPEVQ
jgi:hypothetical protein